MPAQRFFNLTATDVKVDSVLPQFSYALPLSEAYADSIYTVSIAYPEFIDMTTADVVRCKSMPDTHFEALPTVTQRIVTSRRKASLEVTFCPVVLRDGRYQVLVSFMLDVQARPKSRAARRQRATAASPAERYVANSVLATGRWAKVRVPETGIYQLTETLIRKAGLTDLSRVRVYGYGGALLQEQLDGADLQAHDDLREVPICAVGGKRFFHAQGPVSWSSDNATVRTRNPYSQYGYYFITQADDPTATVDSAQFVSSFYPSAADTHWLHEVDNYAWYHGGRNLYEDTPINAGAQHDYALPGFAAHQQRARLSVCVSAGVATSVQILRNGTLLGTMDLTPDSNSKGASALRVIDIAPADTVNDHLTIKTITGGPARLDYISLAYDQPREPPRLSVVRDEPEYVYNITNQNHHADGPCDMVIVIPTSQKLLAQAQRLAQHHEQHDSLRVRIVPADELYNEFSSGTPDASAYRRYLKMLYDRAATDSDLPRYLLLFGDGVWDNRMLSSATRRLNPDDYLLCYESENSFSELYCYVDDGYYTLLDDGEGADLLSSDKGDVAVGRFPVTTAEEARAMVDKTIAYANNANAGAWQNVLMFMGDDGNNNIHMEDVDAAAEQTARLHPGFQIKKVMWDAYVRESSATGHAYPEATRDIKRQMNTGALVMDYSGHGRAEQLSHEAVLRISDFEQFTNANLPLWITASCDIMAFDGVTPTLGETAVLNSRGGAVAFWGTTRTVQTLYNRNINMAFLRHVLSTPGGKPMPIGEAQRLAKNEMITTGQDITANKLQYSLLGDPALALHLPTLQVVVDSIDGRPTSAGRMALQVGRVARVSGHIEGAADFDGVVTGVVRDVSEQITCRVNDPQGASDPFTYTDRRNVIYQGSDSVRQGRFTLTFAVPRDISYSDATSLINLYAVDHTHTRIANGAYDNFTVGGGGTLSTDSIGPSVYCYLNSPQFANGGRVNTTPYFVAEIADEDGINVSDGGVGHGMQLVIDGDMTRTYTLSDNFVFDFGTYTRGTTYYNIPALAPGPHTLAFRVWDVLNNATTTRLDFTVVQGLEPTIFSVDLSKNPATTSTTFIVNHDRTGSDMDIDIDVFDMSGRLLWTHHESGVPTSGAYTVDWDLTLDSGARLQTGVYLYRVRAGSDGSKKASKAKKLIVIGNK